MLQKAHKLQIHINDDFIADISSKPFKSRSQPVATTEAINIIKGTGNLRYSCD